MKDCFALKEITNDIHFDITSLFVLMDELPKFIHKGNNGQIEAYIKKLQTYGHLYVIIEKISKCPIALIGFYANDELTKTAYLSCITVLPNFQKEGLGQSLFDTMCKVAKQRKMETIRFNVVKTNQKALNFYYKNGATLIGAGNDANRFLMQKVLV